MGEEITVETSPESLREIAQRHDVELQPKWGAPEIVVELYEQLVEDSLITPTFVMDYPSAVKPLAKSHRSKPGLNEAWDLIINGVELTPAYSELNDPVVQRRSARGSSPCWRRPGDPEAMELDEVFLKAMEFGMPPAGGMGMGVDRLIMLLTGSRYSRHHSVSLAAAGVALSVLTMWSVSVLFENTQTLTREERRIT